MTNQATITQEPAEPDELEYIPAEKVMHLFKHSNLSICAEMEERMHGENVMADFNISVGDHTEEDVQDLIDEGMTVIFVSHENDLVSRAHRQIKLVDSCIVSSF